MQHDSRCKRQTGFTTGKVLVAICLVLSISGVTAWVELAWQPAVLLVLFIGVLIERGLAATFIRGRITWRADLLMIGTALFYPAFAAGILHLVCVTPISSVLASCDPILVRRLLLGNFYFFAIGLLGAWAARRFDLWHSGRR